jgi:hypothetical protein
MQLGAMLNHMIWAVDSIVSVRDTALSNVAQVEGQSKIHSELVGLAEAADTIRKKIVATKEGGAITGEERLREYLGDLYGDVSRWEGRPTDEQVARAEVMKRQLDDVVAEFNKLTQEQLPEINAQLEARKLKKIDVPSEEERQKTALEAGSARATAVAQQKRAERD